VFEVHPSLELRRAFRERPYQGAVPEQAEFVFVGLDANYDAEFESAQVFQQVLEYHRDAVTFWRRHGVHHPFLLRSYSGDGRRYHRNFARIGFTPTDAEKISFVELLHLPTLGRSKLDAQDLDRRHLAWIGSLVTSGAKRAVFVSPRVVRLMRASGEFHWLASNPGAAGPLPVLYSGGGTQMYLHLHFSNYGKFQARLDREARAIAGLARLLNTADQRS